MSRTTRRNKKHLIHTHVGTPDDFVGWKYRRLPPEIAYQRAVARFTRDRHSGIYNHPSWWVRLHYTRPSRRHAKTEIRRCLRQDCWDDHVDQKLRGARTAYYWWMT